MGYYVNPTDGSTKESFLRKHGRQVAPNEAQVTATELPVVLVDNRAFTAAGIAFDEAELKAFSEPGDNRKKMFYQVPRDVLQQFM